MPLSEHVYCVAIASKITERVEQWICIKFCVKLEHSSTETIWIIQKAAAMGNWWLAASLRQPASSHVMSRAVFSWNIQSPRWLSPSTTQIWCPATSAFSPKLTSLSKVEREEISDHWWDSGKYDRATDGHRENHVRSQGVYFEGDWGVIVLCTMFLVSCNFFNKCLHFS